MLTFDQINALRDAAGQITGPITAYLLRDIARRVSEAGEMTATSAYQIWRSQQLGVSQREIKRELRRLLGLSHQEIRRIFYQCAQSGYSLDVSRFPMVQAVPFEQNAVLQQIVSAAVELAQDDLSNMVQTIGFVTPNGRPEILTQAYVTSCDFAFQQVVTGAASYTEAIRQATRELANKGVRVIDYDSGVHTSLEAAVRRNIMGGLGLMQEKISQTVHDQLGCDGWEITAHANSAPDHEPIQGKQYADAAYKELNENLRRQIGTLNCGHAAFPIILGVNSPQYTKEELEKFRTDNEKGVTVDGVHYTGYQATQMQRRLETAIRRQKNRIMVDEAAGDQEKLAQDKTKLAVLHQRYREFSKAAGLRTQYERTEVAGFGEKRGIANSDGRGILDDKETAAIKRYISSDSYHLNSALRGEQPMTETLISFRSDLDSALGKLPVYRGITYRSLSDFGIPDVDAFLKSYQPGEKVLFPAYLSSGTKVYDPEFPIQYVIQGKTGRDLREFNPEEFEILFPRGREFLIQKVEGNTIYMEEVENG